MRITNQYVTATMIKHMQNNLSRLMETQEQMATTKRVNRLSDDPTILSPLLAVKANLVYNDQYDRNLDDGIAYLDVADSTLLTVGRVLENAYAETLKGVNGHYSGDQRQATALQIDKYIDEILEMGNAAVGSKYIFAGKKSGDPPFERIKDPTPGSKKEWIIFKGDLDRVEREVAAHSAYPINEPAAGFGNTTPPTQPGVFGWAKDGTADMPPSPPAPSTPFQVLYVDDPDASPNPGESSDYSGAFKELFLCRNRLNDVTNANQEVELEKSIGELQKARDKVLQFEVAVGSRWNQFKDMKSELLNQNISLLGTESFLEDADIEKLSIVMAQQKLAREASLAVGATILRTTLLDFMR